MMPRMAAVRPLGTPIVRFGISAFVSERAARKGRNPRTGEAVDIKASRIPRFRAGKALKDAIN